MPILTRTLSSDTTDISCNKTYILYSLEFNGEPFNGEFSVT